MLLYVQQYVINHSRLIVQIIRQILWYIHAQPNQPNYSTH